MLLERLVRAARVRVAKLGPRDPLHLVGELRASDSRAQLARELSSAATLDDGLLDDRTHRRVLALGELATGGRSANRSRRAGDRAARPGWRSASLALTSRRTAPSLSRSNRALLRRATFHVLAQHGRALGLQCLQDGIVLIADRAAHQARRTLACVVERGLVRARHRLSAERLDDVRELGARDLGIFMLHGLPDRVEAKAGAERHVDVRPDHAVLVGEPGLVRHAPRRLGADARPPQNDRRLVCLEQLLQLAPLRRRHDRVSAEHREHAFHERLAVRGPIPARLTDQVRDHRVAGVLVRLAGRRVLGLGEHRHVVGDLKMRDQRRDHARPRHGRQAVEVRRDVEAMARAVDVHEQPLAVRVVLAPAATADIVHVSTSGR